MRSIALIIIFLNSAFCFGQFAEFSFSDKKVYKASPVDEGEVLRYTWHFENTGDEPLVISDYDVSCTCTKVYFSKAPVLPGARDSIRVEFDSKQKIGWQYRKIGLIANTRSGEEELEFRVKVNEK